MLAAAFKGGGKRNSVTMETFEMDPAQNNQNTMNPFLQDTGRGGRENSLTLKERELYHRCALNVHFIAFIMNLPCEILWKRKYFHNKER